MNVHHDIQELLAQAREATAQVEAATSAQRQMRETERAKHAQEDDALATRRRNGELGRDWQTLQQRIDMHRTTLDDVLSGVDLSDEARAVRLQIQREVVPRVRAEFAEAMTSDDLASHLDELHQAQAMLQDALRSLPGTPRTH